MKLLGRREWGSGGVGFEERGVGAWLLLGLEGGFTGVDF